MLRTCCLLLCLAAGTRQLSITELIVPNSVEAGSSAELQCRYSLKSNESEKGLYVKWWWTPDIVDLERRQLYQRIVGSPATALHHNVELKDNDTIVLLDLKPTDTGRYECEVSNIDEVRSHEQLTVFTQGTGPQLNISVVQDGEDEDEEEDVLIECQAEEVAPLPVLTISINREDVNVTDMVIDPDDSLYKVYTNVTLSKKDVEGAEVRCELFYSNPNITHIPFVDTEIFEPSGAALSTTETPEDASNVEATPESLQNTRDYGSRLQCSWISFLAAVLLIKFSL